MSEAEEDRIAAQYWRRLLHELDARAGEVPPDSRHWMDDLIRSFHERVPILKVDLP